MRFRKELRFRDGHYMMLQYVIYPPFRHSSRRALHIIPRPKALPDQTYNDTVATNIGRKSGHFSYTLVCSLMRSWDRGPGRGQHYSNYADRGSSREQPNFNAYFVGFGFGSDRYE